MHETIDSVVRRLGEHWASRVAFMEEAARRDVARIRRACRTQLGDVIAEVAAEAKVRWYGVLIWCGHQKTNVTLISKQIHHQAQTTRLRTTQTAHVESQQSRLQSLKKECRLRADSIGKLRTQISRAQLTLKKSGVVDTDVSISHN